MSVSFVFSKVAMIRDPALEYLLHLMKTHEVYGTKIGVQPVMVNNYFI